MACPICGKETAQAYRPFCSKRCADVDLARWLGGGYALPAQDQEDLDEALDAAQDASDAPDRPH